jgi:hypothetical protein
MRDCIQAVLEFLQENDRKVKPKKVAKAILLVYDEMKERENRADAAAAKFTRRLLDVILE